MQLKSISLKQDGHYVACLAGDHGDDVSFVAMSLGELYVMIPEYVSDLEELYAADGVFDTFLERLIQDGVVDLNTLHATFRHMAA